MGKEKTGIASLEQIQSWYYNDSLPSESCQEIFDIKMEFVELDISCFNQAIYNLLKTEASLRTTLFLENGMLLQKVRPFDPEGNYIIYWDATKYGNIEKFINDVKLSAEINIKVSSSDSYCKCLLFKIDTFKWRVIFLVHHIICDAWSITIIRKRISSLYQGALKGETEVNTFRNSNLIDYANLQQEQLSVKKNRVIAYWDKKLRHQIHGRVNNFVSNFAGINAGRKANTQEWHAGNLLGSQPSRIFLRELSADMYSDIQAICTDNNLSIMSVLSGIFMIIPWLFGEVRPTLIASPMTNRIKKDTRELIGHLTGAIYICNEINGEISILSFLQKVFMSVLNSVNYIIHDHDALGINGNALRLNCDIFFNVISKEFDLSPDIKRLSLGEEERENSYYPLNCIIIETPKVVYMDWGYNRALYNRQQIDYLINMVVELVKYSKYNMNEPLIEMRDKFKKR